MAEELFRGRRWDQPLQGRPVSSMCCSPFARKWEAGIHAHQVASICFLLYGRRPCRVGLSVVVPANLSRDEMPYGGVAIICVESSGEAVDTMLLMLAKFLYSAIPFAKHFGGAMLQSMHLYLAVSGRKETLHVKWR